MTTNPVKAKYRYRPNSFTRSERIRSVLAAIFIVTFGTIGVIYDSIYLGIYSKIGRKDTIGMHFQGIPCKIMYAAFLLAAINILTLVVDHYDTRDNERNYRKFEKITRYIGWALFAIAFVLSAYHYT